MMEAAIGGNEAWSEISFTRRHEGRGKEKLCSDIDLEPDNIPLKRKASHCAQPLSSLSANSLSLDKSRLLPGGCGDGDEERWERLVMIDGMITFGKRRVGGIGWGEGE
ncbi:hypothetical protein COCNU_07G006400 [Cocos nucifera]|uniref:Uncharacterized protein n=1 Tax=Cocos nucifera TaxID=13894 RepID=A0A8K0N4N3_COCNU|nr:hypothetical protein [Cocos nucifera]KAG1354528.1 hypothetical protein COCNU_07G006400 [Cocos nucifera]